MKGNRKELHMMKITKSLRIVFYSNDWKIAQECSTGILSGWFNPDMYIWCNPFLNGADYSYLRIDLYLISGFFHLFGMVFILLPFRLYQCDVCLHILHFSAIAFLHSEWTNGLKMPIFGLLLFTCQGKFASWP